MTTGGRAWLAGPWHGRQAVAGTAGFLRAHPGDSLALATLSVRHVLTPGPVIRAADPAATTAEDLHGRFSEATINEVLRPFKPHLGSRSKDGPWGSLDQLMSAGRWLLGDDAGTGKEVLEGRDFWQCHCASLSDARDSQAKALNRIGELLIRTAHTGRAHDHHDQALAVARGIPFSLEEARALEGIASSRLHDGDPSQAAIALRQALTICRA